jgi:glutathionylspermidine synthase
MSWMQGKAHVECPRWTGSVDFVFRFFPAEWLPRLSSRTGWDNFIVGGLSPVCNPAYSVLTQSKRFPLVWDRLSTPLPTWRSLLPETRSPREIDFARCEDWVLKPALGHEGLNVAIRGVNESADWQRIQVMVKKNPDAWAAQRRFELLSISTPDGPLYPCLGVYVIDGQEAGAYGRIAAKPIINDRSRDVVILMKKSIVGESS